MEYKHQYNLYQSLKWKQRNQRDLEFFQNNLEFSELVFTFDYHDFYFPNYKAAPWHVQVQIGEKFIDFWPHKMKAHVQYEKGAAVGGTLSLVDLIMRIEEDQRDPITGGFVTSKDDDLDLIE